MTGGPPSAATAAMRPSSAAKYCSGRRSSRRGRGRPSPRVWLIGPIVRARADEGGFASARRPLSPHDEHTFVTRPSDRPTGGPMLTDRQQQIWNYLVEYVDHHGYPPTVREIGEEVGLASPSTVHAHLANLERAGLLRRAPPKPRALELLGRA